MLSQLIRYAPVIALIERARPRRILEVGPGSQGLGKFLTRRFVGAETDFSDYTGGARRVTAWMLAVRADAGALPFAGGTFDVVLMLDVLEHVPPSARARELDRWLGARGLPCPGWLAEHLAHPFPTAGELAGALDGARCSVLDNEWLAAHRFFERWEARPRGARASALLADLLAPTDWDWRVHRVATSALRVVTRPFWPLLRVLDRRPAYRTLMVIDKVGPC